MVPLPLPHPRALRTKGLGALTAALAAAAGLCLASGCDNKGPIKPPPDRYREMVAAFYTGVVAMEAGDNSRARQSLTQASAIVPDEPASWINLATLFLHGSGQNPAEAAKALDKARSLAPDDASVALLSGIQAANQQQIPKAIEQLRRAVQLDPKSMAARHQLIQQLERQPGPDAEKAIAEQWQEILKLRPDNLVARMALARSAARAGDAKRAKEQLQPLTELAPSWPQNARDSLAGLLKSIDSGKVQELAVRGFGNLLLQTPQWRHSSDDFLLRPVYRFLRLPSPPSSPAEPDPGITFQSEPLPGALVTWARAEIVSPAQPPDFRESHAGSGATAVAPAAGNAPAAAPGGNAPPAASEGPSTEVPPDPPPAIVRGSQGAVTLGLKQPLILPTPGGMPAAGVLLADWSYDYRPDLALAGPGGLQLYQQITPGQFLTTASTSGLSPAVLKGSYQGAWASDFDLDADLDLVLGTTSGPPVVLRNNGDGKWAQIRLFEDSSAVRDLLWNDLDGDGDADAAILDALGKVTVYDDLRGGAFSRLELPTEVTKALAISVADANGDGHLDLLILLPDGRIMRLDRQDGATGWTTAEAAKWDGGASAKSARLLWGDLDNNGAIDLIASDDKSAQVFLGAAKGGFQALSAPIGAAVYSVADLDNDLRLDMVGVDSASRPVRLINKGTKAYHAQLIRPRSASNIVDDSAKQKASPFGFGGEAELRAGLLTQKQPLTKPTLHFGLGEQTKANYLRFVWPTGQIQGEFEIPADVPVMAQQRLNVSCPWLFADDGTGVKFVTDVLWKSPLGLKINAQDTAGVSQTRDWVKVRGDQLRAKNGEYDLRITAELWETHFFDYVALMAVDHPEGTEVWVDERFSIPQPELKLHVTTPLRPAKRVLDQRGEDVTALVRDRDEKYLDTFELGDFQGVAEDHFVELEVPAAPPGGRLVLLGAGWVFPTNSSVNLALAQGSHEPPRGISIEVPDGNGGWRTARSGLGFPAGKTKTVLLDLSDLKGPGGTPPRRIRLRTNLEVYWDQLAFTTELPAPNLRTRTSSPKSAELRFRGYSETRYSRRTPELPIYDHVETPAQKWRDLVGFCTRFGDVKELLEKVDDRYVIMNAGDEMAFRFPEVPAPATGWVRDYVFISDGWEKDGNLNTGFSKTVLPLPSHDDPDYTRPPGRLEDEPVYRRYPQDWQKYHTRYVTPDAFRSLLWGPQRK